ADEPRVGESAVVVLGYDYWQAAFGGDPDVVGRTLAVNGSPLTIVGVGPKNFSSTTIGAHPQVYVPLSMRWVMEPTVPQNAEDRLAYWVYAFARLRPNVTLEQASAAINGIYRGIVQEVEAPLNAFLPPDVLERFEQKQIGVTAGARGQSEIPRTASQPLKLLLGVTALVLLIVCVNSANLLLARGAARTGELAIRASIGASGKQLLAHSLSETAVLTLVGGLASLPVAAAILAGVEAMTPVVQVGTGLANELDAAV